MYHEKARFVVTDAAASFHRAEVQTNQPANEERDGISERSSTYNEF